MVSRLLIRTWRHRGFALALNLVLFAATAGAADTLRIVSYNALNFRGAQDADRREDFRIVMRSINPDVGIMQEIISEDAVDDLLAFAYLPVHSDFAAVPFDDGPDTDNALFYRTSKVNFLSQRAIHTQLRDITEYVLQPVADTTQRLRIYSAHLKASEGSDNEERRRAECAVLRAQLDLLPAGSQFMMCGDFNLYTAEEPAYQLLLSNTPNINGRLFDPIDEYGDWREDVSFIPIHTQSPRRESFGGGATGGLDDRFDFQLVSAGLMDTTGIYILPASYKAWGNDGQHHNLSINSGVNHAVPDSVADALYYASDHLPVVANYVVKAPASPVVDRPATPREHQLLTCYPNPFNSTLSIEIGAHGEAGELAIFDVLGRQVWSRTMAAGAASTLSQRVNFAGLGTGTYYVRFRTPAVDEVQRVMYVR